MLTKNSEIFLSEIDKDSKIQLGKLIDKFQDVGWLHLQELLRAFPKFPSATLFFVTSQDVNIYLAPILGETISIRSTIVNANRHKITRLVNIFSDTQKILATQVEDAFFVNKTTRRLTSLPVDFPITSIIDGTKKSFHRKRVILPSGLKKSIATFWVLPRDIDNYNHMNNARYFDFIKETTGQIKELLINYVKPAALGMLLCFQRTQEGRVVYYNVCNSDKCQIAKIKLLLNE